jgi:hypothetical protein
MAIANGLALPNPLSNGTTADAVPVMADLNYLLTALNRALLDQGGTAGINANSTQIHNLANGTAGNDAVNLSQLQVYLPLAGGALTGGLTGTTLNLSSTLGVTGAATLATLTASGLITANAGVSGTTATWSGAVTANGGITTTSLNASGLLTAGANLLLSVNSSLLQFTDLSGTHPYFISQNDNNFAFYGTDATGNPRIIWWVGMRSSTSVFQVNPGAQLNSTLSVTGATAVAALTASGLITGNAGFSGTTLSLSGAATLSGGGTSTTPSAGDNSTKIATTAFVQTSRAPNVQSVTSAGTVTPTFSNDAVDITAQAAALTLANPSGTAVNDWGWLIRIVDNGTPQTIAYGTQYVGIGFTLPSTTVAGKALVLGCVWNANKTRVEVVSMAQE